MSDVSKNSLPPPDLTSDIRHLTSCLYALKGIPSPFKSARACSSVRALVMIEMFMPRSFSTLLKSISGKISCSRTPIV
jgi:hypothetical protein